MQEGRAFQVVHFVTWGSHSGNPEVFEPPLFLKPPYLRKDVNHEV